MGRPDGIYRRQSFGSALVVLSHSRLGALPIRCQLTRGMRFMTSPEKSNYHQRAGKHGQRDGARQKKPLTRSQGSKTTCPTESPASAAPQEIVEQPIMISPIETNEGTFRRKIATLTAKANLLMALLSHANE